MRAAGTEKGCRSRAWVPLDRTLLDKWILGSPRFFQFRVAAKGELGKLPHRLALALRRQEAGGEGVASGYFAPAAAAQTAELPPIFPMTRAGARFFRAGDREWTMEFDEPRRINVVSVLLGVGVWCARQLVIQTYDKGLAGWGAKRFVRPERRIAVLGFPEVVTQGVKVTVPWGLAEVQAMEARYVPAMVASLESALFHAEEPGYPAGTIPVLGENEFRVRIATLARAASTGMLSLTLRQQTDDGVKVLGKSEKPVSLDPEKPTEESVILHAGRLGRDLSLRLELRLQEPRARPFQILECPATPAPPLTSRLVFPGYRKSLYSSQKTDVVEVEGLLAKPKKVIEGRMALAVRLAIGRREPPYRVKEYRTTGMGGMSSRRPLLRLRLKDTPPGHFKAIVTTHSPPVMSQANIARDDLFILPPAEHEVWFGASGEVRVNGTPVFPLGFRDVPDDEKVFEQLAAAGVNVVHVAGAKPETLGSAAKSGLKVIVGLTGTAIEKVDEESRGRLKEQTAPFIGRASLLAWTVGAATPGDETKLANGYTILRELDPYHPVLLLATYDSGLCACAGTADLIGGPAASAQAPFESRFHFVEEAHALAKAQSKGVVACLPKAPARELRCLTFGAVASGANGILLDWNCWPGAQALIKEVADLAPYLVTERQKLPPAGTEFPFPAARVQAGAEERVIVVNNLPKARELSWPSPFEKSKRLRDPSSGRVLHPRNGNFRGSFAPHEVHVYEVVRN